MFPKAASVEEHHSHVLELSPPHLIYTTSSPGFLLSTDEPLSLLLILLAFGPIDCEVYIYSYKQFLELIPASLSAIIMAAPADITVKSLNGEWVLVSRSLLALLILGRIVRTDMACSQDKSVSDPADPVLALVSVYT